jgi:hypothetical protein
MSAHLVARAKRAGKRLTRADARALYRRADRIPNDVQWLAHAAFEAAGEVIDTGAIETGLAAIVRRQAGFFAERFESLAPSQQRIVRELARSPREKVYAKAFLDTVMVANANAVTTALRTLTEQEIVRREGRQWRLASPFFRAWLLGQLEA